jgi:beta-lactamase class D
MSFKRISLSGLLLSLLLLASCHEARVKEHKDWAKYFEAQGIKQSGFILRDHTHDVVHYYNLEHDTAHYLPASTFKIFNSLVAIETGIAADDRYMIKWNGQSSGRPECDKDMTMREAFRESCVSYYQELARQIGQQRMQHYLDTVNYGNRKIGGAIDSFWLNNSLQISPDEQVGFIKRLYFGQLPFSDRTQRIVRSMMLREQDSSGLKLYYKTGWGKLADKQVLWIVGFAENEVKVKEPKESMNKSDVRNYVYFFAENFEIPANDTSKDWFKVRLDILHQVLEDYGVKRPY